jgi:hypothetical protein
MSVKNNYESKLENIGSQCGDNESGLSQNRSQTLPESEIKGKLITLMIKL